MLFHYMAQVLHSRLVVHVPISCSERIYDILCINIRFSCKNEATVNGPKFYGDSLQHTKHTLTELCCIPVLWYGKPPISVSPFSLLPYEMCCISPAFKLPDNGTWFFSAISYRLQRSKTHNFPPLMYDKIPHWRHHGCFKPE